jgi:CheY-like chemotaxis protein
MRLLLPSLPSAAPRPETRPATQGRGDRVSLNGRVLVVDDEQAVGEFMRDLLESWGLEVTLVASGAQACAVFADGQRFDAVITDQTMPRMTGLELARELVAVKRDIPVILYSGYNESLGKLSKHEAIRAVISKPVAPPELLSLLRTYLPESAAAH